MSTENNGNCHVKSNVTKKRIGSLLSSISTLGCLSKSFHASVISSLLNYDVNSDPNWWFASVASGWRAIKNI